MDARTKLFIFLALAALTSCNKIDPQPVAQPTTILQPLTPQPEHNFELVQLGAMRRDQYLIDKTTGQIWQKTCVYSLPKSSAADCAYTAWMKEDVQDLNGATSASIEAWGDALKKRNSK